MATRVARPTNTVAWLRFLNDNFPNKPIHISEFASTFRCAGTNQDTVEFGIQKMTRFYNAIKDEFPRVKSVNWFLWDTITGKKANNNYSFLEDGRALLAYRNTINDPYFLSSVKYDPQAFSRSIKHGTTIGPLGAAMRPGVPLNQALEDWRGFGRINRTRFARPDRRRHRQGDWPLRARNCRSICKPKA